MRSVVLLLANLFKNTKSETGSVAIVALVIMVVLGALGATLIQQSSTGSKISASYSDGIAAQYLAEAGIEHAKVELANQSYPTTADGIKKVVDEKLTNQKLINGSTASYSVTIRYANNSYTITSIGTVNKAKRQVIKTLNNKKYKFAVYGGENSEELFNKVLNRGVSIYPSVNIEGDVGCKTDIHYGAYMVTGALFGKISIDGDVVTGGEIVTWPSFGGINLTGEVREKSKEKRDIPTVVFPSNFKNSPNINLDSVKDTSLFGRSEYTLVTGKTYYTSGDLILYNHTLGGDSITGNGTIFVNGDVIINGNPIPPHIHLPGSANITGNITLIVKGNVILEPLTSMGGEMLVMAGGEIWVGTGIGFRTPNNLFPSVATYPAFLQKGVFLANGNIFINNVGSVLEGCAISKKTVTLYGNADIRYKDAVMTNIKARGLMPQLPE